MDCLGSTSSPIPSHHTPPFWLLTLAHSRRDSSQASKKKSLPHESEISPPVISRPIPRWRRARSDSPNVGSQGIPESPKFSFQNPCCVNIPMTLNGAGLFTYIWWILMVKEVNIPYIESFGYISRHNFQILSILIQLHVHTSEFGK